MPQRSTPAPERSTPQRHSADFQSGGFGVQTAPADAQLARGRTTPFQTHFYSDAFCPAWPVPVAVHMFLCVKQI